MLEDFGKTREILLGLSRGDLLHHILQRGHVAIPDRYLRGRILTATESRNSHAAEMLWPDAGCCSDSTLRRPAARLAAWLSEQGRSRKRGLARLASRNLEARSQNRKAFARCLQVALGARWLNS